LPQDHPDRVKLNDERIRHWLGVGAKPSDRVAKFLGQAEIIEMPAIRETPKKSAPRAKTLERMKEAEEAAAPAEEAAVEEAPAKEAPAEEASAEEAAAEEASAEEAAAEEAPAGEAPAEEAAEEAPAEEAEAEEEEKKEE
jgi:small subunit ribosomal protein S16